MTNTRFDPAGECQRLFQDIPWRRYVAMGDSTAEGSLGDPYPPYPDVGYAEMVADALAAICPDLSFFNLGERDLTTRQIRETQLDRAVALEPDLAIINAGGNDMFRERFDPSVTEVELEAVVTSLQGTGATVVTGTLFNILAAGVMPADLVDMLRPRFEALSDTVRAVAARTNIVLIDFAMLPWTTDADLFSTDLRHLNRRGHAAAAEAVIRRLADHIEAVRSRPAEAFS